MMGNLSNMFFIQSIDGTLNFTSHRKLSYYSFAVSMMGIILMMINSISMTFYPYFSRGYEVEQIKKIKIYLIIIGAISSTGYFILSLIVTNFIGNYVPSLQVISILFVGFPAIGVINALYVNLFKVNKQERRYFYKTLKMLSISIILNTLAVLINLSNFSIAIATTIAFYFWFFSSSKDFPGLETNIKEIAFIFLYIPLFLFCSIFLNYITGFVLFTLGVFVLVWLFYKKEFKELVDKLIKR